MQSSLTQWCQLFRKVWSQRPFMGHVPLYTSQAVLSLLATYRAICSREMTTRTGLPLRTKWTMSLDRPTMSSVPMPWNSVAKAAHQQHYPQPLLNLTGMQLIQNSYPWPLPSRSWKLCSARRLSQRSNPSVQILIQSSEVEVKLGL